MDVDDFEMELKDDFLEEALSLLESCEQSFLELEEFEPDSIPAELMDEIFRFAHNLKGTSRAVGFGEVAEFTHELENLILALKEHRIPVTENITSILLKSNDHLSKMINGLRSDMNATFDSADLIAKLIQALSSEKDREENKKIVEVELDIDILKGQLLEEEKAELEAENKKRREDLEGCLSFHKEEAPGDQNEAESDIDSPGLKVMKGSNEVLPDKEPQNVQRTQVKKKMKQEDESIRVSLSRVENLNNFVGELVILQTVLDERGKTNITDELTIKSIGHLGKLAKEIQEIAMGLRMIPVKTTLQKMKRIVRDTSSDLKKKVALILTGEETEIDKTVLEHLADPLVHIVRNAVDHGCEMPEKRLLAGKSEISNMEIKAYHEGDTLVIEVIDDGNGIDSEVLKEKAISKGIIESNTLMGEEELVNLIFHPGFSTKEEVSEVSGRGVGMDVVKTNIERLHGEVFIKTRKGKGSTFKIVLPLTLAIIDGMVCEIGTQHFIIPLAQVSESMRIPIGHINEITGVGEFLNLRGEVIPLLDICKELGIKSKKKRSNQIAMIIKDGRNKLAISVDDIIRQQQVVIKKLGTEIKNQKGFTGTTILGDGKPAFILDIPELYSQNKVSTKSLKKSSFSNAA